MFLFEDLIYFNYITVLKVIDREDPSAGLREKVDKVGTLNRLDSFNMASHSFPTHLGNRVTSGAGSGPASLQANFGGLVETLADWWTFREIILRIDDDLISTKDNQMIKDGVEVESG